MIRCTAIIVFTFFVSVTLAQTEQDSNKDFGPFGYGIFDGDTIYSKVDQMAEFEGGLEGLAQYLSKNVKYPKAARKSKVQGSVFVAFVVDREGQVRDVDVVKGIHPECDEVSKKVVEQMPKWKPAMKNGKPVVSRFVLPIKYRLG